METTSLTSTASAWKAASWQWDPFSFWLSQRARKDGFASALAIRIQSGSKPTNRETDFVSGSASHHLSFDWPICVVSANLRLKFPILLTSAVYVMITSPGYWREIIVTSTLPPDAFLPPPCRRKEDKNLRRHGSCIQRILISCLATILVQLSD